MSDKESPPGHSLLFEGELIHRTDSPDNPDMANCDTLKVYQEQVGGRRFIAGIAVTAYMPSVVGDGWE